MILRAGGLYKLKCDRCGYTLQNWHQSPYDALMIALNSHWIVKFVENKHGRKIDIVGTYRCVCSKCNTIIIDEWYEAQLPF